MSKKEFFYDIRAIRMVKSTKRRPLSSYVNQDRDFFICLGHFDIMKVVALRDADGKPTKEPLKAIHSDSQNFHCVIEQDKKLEDIEENYAYPLYVLQQFEQDKIDNGCVQDLDTFWTLDTNFLTVTRFHCDRTDNSSTTDAFSKILSTRCENMAQATVVFHSRNAGNFETGYIRLKIQSQHGQAGAVEVSLAFYESLELGDIVGFIKSNSLSAILAVQRHLYETDEVRDAYTHCGIDRKLFDCSSEVISALLHQRAYPLESSLLNYVSMRFSIKDVNVANSFFEEVFDNTTENFFVTGTADAVVNLNGSSEQIFLETTRRIVHAQHDMYDAFNDIITRVGLCYIPPTTKRSELLKFKRADFCRNFPKYQEMIQKLYNPADRAYPWSSSLIKLLATLRTMYENCVMDDLSDLLVPGVQALLERISFLMDSGSWTSRDHRDIWEFLEYWTSLVNDIAHLESQLVQHPELTAVRYYIPAMVLRFEQKLVSTYVKIIHELDKQMPAEMPLPQREAEVHRTFGPILFICSDENVNTMCFLDPEYHDQYTGSCPLGIFVPIHRLYQPWEIAHILCHEIAHYCGDHLRHRNRRLDCLFESVAAFLLAELDALFDNPNLDETIYEERAFQEKTALRIKQQYPSVEDGRSVYLKFISEKLPSTVMKVGFRQENLEEYQNILLARLSPEEQLAKVYRANKMNAMETGVIIERECRDHILECLLPLYKECYADIIMILLLDCTFADYYFCVYAEEYEKNGQNRVASEHHTDRMALVGLVLHEIQGEANWALDYPKQNAWVKAVKEKMQEWKDVSKKPGSSEYRWPRKYLGRKRLSDGQVAETLHKYTLLADEAAQLLQYLRECANPVKKALESGAVSKRVKELRGYVVAAKDGMFNWNKMRTFLEGESGQL